MAHKEDLGELITLEQGKPLKEAIGEVFTIHTFMFYQYITIWYSAALIQHDNY